MVSRQRVGGRGCSEPIRAWVSECAGRALGCGARREGASEAAAAAGGSSQSVWAASTGTGGAQQDRHSQI